MSNIRWDRIPLVAGSAHPRAWLTIQHNYQLAPNTIEAYGWGVENFLSFCAGAAISYEHVTREHVALWINEMSNRPRSSDSKPNRLLPPSTTRYGQGLSNSTIQQRLTAVRLFYDYLMEEGVRKGNPVGRSQRTSGITHPVVKERGSLRRLKKLPWIPDEEQWLSLLEIIKGESVRNRFMFALQYDCALRRGELCSLEIEDFDFGHRTLRIRAEITKFGRERVVVFSEETSLLLKEYLPRRRELSAKSGALFLSESRRNFAEPISIWTWSKLMEEVSSKSGLDSLSTHTLRHLRLTDLARANWKLQEIAKFAGHRNMNTTMMYIHLSGRELRDKFARSMASIRSWREATIREKLA